MALYKIETYLPEEHLDELAEALNATGALTIGGRYDHCMALSRVTGCWRPLEGAVPYLGQIGEISREEELKVEFGCRGEVLGAALAAIRQVHPYEEPVIHILPLVDPRTLEEGP